MPQQFLTTRKLKRAVIQLIQRRAHGNLIQDLDRGIRYERLKCLAALVQLQGYEERVVRCRLHKYVFELVHQFIERCE